MLAEKDPRVHAVDVLCYEFGAPRKRAHDSIVVALRMLDFAGAHPSSKQIGLRDREKRLKTLADYRQVILKLSLLQNQARLTQAFGVRVSWGCHFHKAF